MQSECKIHGLTEFSEGKIPWCRRCNVEGVIRRHKRLKVMAVEYKGRQCSVCGYDQCVAALQFHHLDPTIKDGEVSTMIGSRSWDAIKLELDKCIMLCANCHFELHAREGT